MKIYDKPPRRWLGGKKGLIAYVVMAFIILSTAIFVLCYYLELEDIRKNVDFEHPVTATIDEVVPLSLSQTPKFDIKYKYVAEDGTVYTGYYKLGIEGIEEAKAYLGQEVEIYIGTKGKSTAWLSDKEPDTAPLIASIPLFCASAIICIVLIIPYRWPVLEPKTE